MSRVRVLGVLVMMLVSWTAGAARTEEPPVCEASIIFEADTQRLHDGKVSHNHSASLVETPSGQLIACWFHGRGEIEDNTMVVLGARHKRDGSGWSEPFVIADHEHLPDQNPTLFIDPQHRLWLFRISSLDNETRGHFITYLISTDYESDGPPRWTWQAPLFCFPQRLEQTYADAVDHAITAGLIPADRVDAFVEKKDLVKDKLWHRLGWMTRQPPIMLNERRLMLGLYSDLWGCSLAAFTEDGGDTWEFSKPILFPETLVTMAIQPSFVQKQDGGVVAYMRSRRGGRNVERAVSDDGGLTWTREPFDMKCNDSSVAVVRLKSGRWVLAVNDVRGRAVLNVLMSDDEGRTWKWGRALERFELGQGTGEYPTLIQTADGMINVVYTYRNASLFEGRTIKHVRFNESWLMAGDAGLSNSN